MGEKPLRQGDEQQTPFLERQQEQAGELLPLPRTVSFDYGYLSPTPPEGDSWDEWVIEQGITAAEQEDRPIDNRTAHYIAAQLHEGQGSALYSFASTGTIEELAIHQELAYRIYEQPDQVQAWINRLGQYCSLREDKGPIEGWHQQVRDQDRAESEDLRRQQTVAELDALFGEQVAEQIGDVQELGWFGLVRHDGRPGGLILSQDEQGFRHVWETDSDAELQQRWAGINEDYEQFEREVEDQGLAADAALEQQGESGTGAQAAEPVRNNRLAELEERLAPLPDLGDIPRPAWGHSFGSGYEWMEAGLPEGWHVEPSWGRNGWDLGAWPLIAVALFVDENRNRYAVATYTEGDVTVSRYESRGALHVAVNEIAEFHWRLGQSRGPSDLVEGAGLLAKHCGPFSEERYRREIASQAGVHADAQDQQGAGEM